MQTISTILLDLHVTITVSTDYILPSSNSDSYKFSFFPSTIQAWNNLPISVIESDSMQLFIASLNQFYSCTS